MYAVIRGMPVVIGQTDGEEELLEDIAVPETLNDAASTIKNSYDGTLTAHKAAGFQNGTLAAVVMTWVGAAGGRYFLGEDDGPMWGAMLGGLASLSYAMFSNRGR